MSLTNDQICIIKSTAPILADHGIALCNLFYKNLLADNSPLNAVFSQTNQQTGAQPRALAGALLAYAQHIDHLQVLAPTVERVCQKHASLHVTPAQYETVGTYLLDAMAQLLGPETFTPDFKAAWAAAYWQLANFMIQREKQLYDVDPNWDTWRDFVVAEKVPEADGMASLMLKPTDGKALPTYLPGQFVSVNLHVPQLGYKQTRQYSLSDMPRSDRYRISVKKDESNSKNGCTNLSNGIVSNIIHDDISVGDVIEVSKPRGAFHVDVDEETDKPIALLSAGSGITPMVAILESLAAKNSRRHVWFVHTTQNSKLHAFKDRVAEIAQQLGTVSILTVYSQPLSSDRLGVDYDMTGRISPRALLTDTDLVNSECCVCGPSRFMDGIVTELKARGVSDKHVKMELFGTGGLPEPRGSCM